jgi:pyrroloquinoline-quinone synthase
MSRVAELDAIVQSLDLNSHPFYQDWRAGTLPSDKLKVYAAEYGRFVGTIAAGWDTIGEAHYAEEEREHEELWNDFKRDLGVSGTGSLAHTDVLVTAAQRYFAVAPEAVGALYAFEAQQPHTSKSKLDGLNEHYALSDTGKKYFEVHAEDFAEVEDLKEYVAKMSDAEFARAKTACHVVCAAMWSALDGVYYAAPVAD